MRKIERALLSVSDKTDIIPFARGLHQAGVELLSTGGTARALREADLPVQDIGEFTGFPEMLDGRVKTLHPKVHAGLLYLRGNTEHEATLAEHNLAPIDLVCVNLYPFEATVAKPDVSFAEAIENIDIGGPTMLRSAAKNMDHVTVVTDPADYDAVLAEIQAGGTNSQETRRRLGQKVFARVAEYNAAIAAWLANQFDEPPRRPFVKANSDATELRYGENPHQKPAFLFKDPAAIEACIAHTEQLHGKAMSYNNYVDGHAALEAARELVGSPGAAIIKHTNPCGFATGTTLAQALQAAWEGDPVSAFGSVIAVTVPVDLPAAEFLKGRFVEAIVAPDFEADALAFLQAKSSSIRLLKLQHPLAPAVPTEEFRQIGGGVLVQPRDTAVLEHWETPTAQAFPDELRPLAEFGMRACKHVKSNAILLVRACADGFQVIGMGAGQPNRVDSVRKLAIARAKENIANLHAAADNPPPLEQFEAEVLASCVLISDAFFPFPDNIEAAAAVGIRHIVEPGGSVKDDEVIAACDRLGVALALTGMRHFLH